MWRPYHTATADVMDGVGRPVVARIGDRACDVATQTPIPSAITNPGAPLGPGLELAPLRVEYSRNPAKGQAPIRATERFNGRAQGSTGA